MIQNYFNVSFDMDNIDVLYDAYNIGHEDFDRTLMYRTAVRRMIDMLDGMGIKATFFLVGKCCEHPINVSVIKEIVQNGHEIGNHSYSHKENYDISDEEIVLEIEKADTLIKETIGVKPVGYRAPGYQITKKGIEVLELYGYKYDASVMPTVFMASIWFILFLKTFKRRNRPLARRFYHLFNSSGPFRIAGTNFVEIPCPHIGRILPYYPTFHFAFPFLERFTTTRVINLPFLTLEGHALDFLDVEEDGLPRELSEFHPGMKMSWQEKVKYYEKIIKRLMNTHIPVTLTQYVDENLNHLLEKKIFI
ncbi:MAG TPA: DUF2334 domain-containing protein [bacterium]|nr:DUF2334 domain-containing protein [bacterium]